MRIRCRPTIDVCLFSQTGRGNLEVENHPDNGCTKGPGRCQFFMTSALGSNTYLAPSTSTATTLSFRVVDFFSLAIY